MKACWKPENMRRRIDRLRNKPPLVTCPFSRHLLIFADNLCSKNTHERLVCESNKHIAGSIYATVESLYRVRHELAKQKREANDTAQ